MTTNVFNRLLERVKDLPKELRHRIYRFITGWASANQWPQTKVKPGNLINFARRNKTPLYEKIIISEPACEYRSPIIIPHAQSMFMENFRVLDYYKEIEYDNICQFTQALCRYEDSRREQVKLETEHGAGTRTIERINLREDFLRWFWSSNVVDMRSGWLVSSEDDVYISCNKWGGVDHYTNNQDTVVSIGSRYWKRVKCTSQSMIRVIS